MINANELADELKEYALDNGYSHIDYADSINQAATMLRQQQAEIWALKEALKAVVRISDRKHNAWDKAKELLK